YPTLPVVSTTISNAALDADICGCLVPSQLATLPSDPSSGTGSDCTTYDTDYYIVQDATTKRVTVGANNVEAESPAISVTQ
ncbi:MAG: hypothetical protein NUV84_05310, partial [Candidatus Uhrbacteria bacterium]|nr:hypothetical protein [Candidatus Uhrbacteria bacterium]